MTRRGWLLALGTLCGAVLLLAVWRLAQEKNVDAHWHAVHADLEQIRSATIRVWNTTLEFPESVQSLAPKYLSREVVERPPRYDLTHRTIIVPAAPYSIYRITNGFEVSCKFYWAGSQRVIMNSRGESRAE